MFMRVIVQRKSGDVQTVLINPSSISTVKEVNTRYAATLIDLKNEEQIWSVTPIKDFEDVLIGAEETPKKDLKPKSKVVEERYNPSTKSIDQIEVRDDDLPF